MWEVVGHQRGSVGAIGSSCPRVPSPGTWHIRAQLAASPNTNGSTAFEVRKYGEWGPGGSLLCPHTSP